MLGWVEVEITEKPKNKRKMKYHSISGCSESSYSIKLAIPTTPSVFSSVLNPAASYMLVKLSTSELPS